MAIHARSRAGRIKLTAALKEHRRMPKRQLKAKIKRSAPKPAAKTPAPIGIIGGSGLYNMPGLEDARERRVRTPFGDPSDAFVVGRLEGRPVAFLARHGRGHRITPSEINYRANIYAMKLLGVERVVSVSAVGSLREDLRPLEFLVPDQFFDRTRLRISTFFGQGIVAHVAFDKPICPELAAVVVDAGAEAGVTMHRGGTYICMEGPQFSTLAEAHVNRQLRFDVVGMTNLTEAKLAREAELCYSTIAMITDYDCWHPEHDSVTIADIIANLTKNAEAAQRVLRAVLRSLPETRSCRCGSALKHAIVTDPKLVQPAARKRLAAIVGKYLS
jgi:5'-methylthioadenosine phosphorylase